MLEHVSLRTPQFEALVRFYVAALAPLGYEKLYVTDEGVGFGKDGNAPFWIGPSATSPTGIHIALSAANRAAVDNFHRAAIKAGATDHGKPGVRANYAPNYYAAFVIDPDGNNLEAVCRIAVS